MKQLTNYIKRYMIIYTIILLINIVFLWFYKYNHGFSIVMLIIGLIDFFFNIKYIFGRDWALVLFLAIISSVIFKSIIVGIFIALIIYTIFDYFHTIYLYKKNKKIFND